MSIAMLVAGLASAQKLPVKVDIGPNVRVSDAGVPHVELYVAAHPQNPRNLIVTATPMVSGQEGFVGTFSTRDGGNTWSVSHLPQLREAVARKETSGWIADSSVTYAPDGTAYVSAVAPMNRGHAWGRLPVLVLPKPGSGDFVGRSHRNWAVFRSPGNSGVGSRQG